MKVNKEIIKKHSETKEGFSFNFLLFDQKQLTIKNEYLRSKEETNKHTKVWWEIGHVREIRRSLTRYK